LLNLATKAKINYLPSVIFPDDILGFQITVENFQVDEVNVGLNDLGEDVNDRAFVEFLVAFQVVAESSVLAVIQYQVVGGGVFEGFVALDDVGMGEGFMDFEFEFQVFSLLEVQAAQVYNLDRVWFVEFGLFVGFVNFAAVTLTEQVRLLIHIIPHPLLLFRHHFYQVKFRTRHHTVSRRYCEPS
jgi:hypothetical protein